MKKIWMRWATIFIAFSLLMAGCTGTGEAVPLEASGVIEASEVVVSPELGGRVVEMLVHEGDTVSRGDVLFRLDDTILQAQRAAAEAGLNAAHAALRSAEAGLDTAQAQYALVLDAAQAAEAATRADAWFEDAPPDFDEPSWYFSREETRAALEKALETAGDEKDAAEQHL